MTNQIDPRLLEEPSALARHLGLELTAWSDGFARVEAAFEPFMRNRQGLPHGGVLATLLDTAMGFAGCYTGDPARKQNALTLSMTVNYLAQARGTLLVAEARVTGGGRRTFFAHAAITDELGTEVATATGVFRYRSGS